jgi:putative flippase GtrA
VIGLAIRVPILKVGEPLVLKILNQAPVTLTTLKPEIIAKNLVLALAIVVVMLWNYFANRYWTYADVK